MENEQKPANNGLLIAGIILCFMGPTFIIGFIFIVVYIIKNAKNTMNNETFKNQNDNPNTEHNEDKPKEKTPKPTKCPSCGANIKKNESKCPYCDTIFE